MPRRRDPSPCSLAVPQDRFPLGLPGRVVPVQDIAPSGLRPWGMDRARMPTPIEAGRHDKPTGTAQKKVPTEYTEDSKTKKDDYTQTVTD